MNELKREDWERAWQKLSEEDEQLRDQLERLTGHYTSAGKQGGIPGVGQVIAWEILAKLGILLERVEPLPGHDPLSLGPNIYI